jgi:hypothetical protein
MSCIACWELQSEAMEQEQQWQRSKALHGHSCCFISLNISAMGWWRPLPEGSDGNSCSQQHRCGICWSAVTGLGLRKVVAAGVVAVMTVTRLALTYLACATG